MSHLVPPVSFRSGKTFPWKTNFLTANQKSSPFTNSNLGLNTGLEEVSKHILTQYRLFVIKGVLKYSEKINTLYYNLLYVPRLKQKPIDSLKTRSDLSSKFFYNTKRFNKDFGYPKVINYCMERYLKIADLSPRVFRFHRRGKYLRGELLRLLTLRIFRGSPHLNQYKRSFKKFKTFQTKYRFSKNKNLSIINYPNKKKFYLFNKTIKQKRYARNQTWLLNQPYILNNCELTVLYSNLLKQNIKVKAMNAFSYLLKKRIINYQSHQRHLWHWRLKRRRTQFANYFDILNAVYFAGIIKHTENFLLTILCITLPLLEKLKKFLYFVDSVIKNIATIKKSFSCFRLTITGKLAGGTKRTKIFSIGYGRVAVQSLTSEISNNFTCFAHKAGEFGVKLLMNRTLYTKV